MRGFSSLLPVIVLIIFILVLELINYWGMKNLIPEKKQRRRVRLVYWGVTALLFVFYMIAFINPDSIRETTNYNFFYFVISLLVLYLFPKMLTFLFVAVSFPFHRLGRKHTSKIIVSSGLILGLGMMLSIAYGIFKGRKTIQVNSVEVKISSLPKELDGITIAQISDLHLGSFENDNVLKKCADEINSINPDLLLFTGDMVNNFSDEMIGFEDQLSAMGAKYGKMAILGNHDYGDYSSWNTEEDKSDNLSTLEQKIEDAGFELLLNESRRIEINNTPFYVIGVENWGHRPFPQYAELDKAMNEIPDDSFKILMSHDPSHWEGEVLNSTDIPLMLAGHTHAAQFSFMLAGINFSPMFFIQKYWGGLYEENNQFLYVNSGFGCIGFLGRIDMAPEITLLTLRSN